MFSVVSEEKSLQEIELLAEREDSAIIWQVYNCRHFLCALAISHSLADCH